MLDTVHFEKSQNSVDILSQVLKINSLRLKISLFKKFLRGVDERQIGYSMIFVLNMRSLIHVNTFLVESVY